MAFRFGTQRSLGLPIGGGTAVASFIWNPADSYGSSRVLSNGNKTVTETPGTDYANIRATAAVATSIARVVVDSFGTELQYGLIPLATNLNQSGGDLSPAAGSYLYRPSGQIFKNGSSLGNVGLSYAVGDRISVSADDSTVSFYKNDIIVYQTPRISGQTGALYPCVSLLRSGVTFNP